MKLSHFVFAIVLSFAPAVTTWANTDPPTWLDVQNYGADPTCTNDSGTAINNAINAATTPGQVIFFPKGCYLIKTQIVDQNSTYGLTYLGFGRAELSAGTGLTGSIFKFGSDTITAARRRMDDFLFECNGLSGIDGIDVDGLSNSEFINVEIRDCATYGLRTVGSNGNNYKNVFEGGGVATYSLSANGFQLRGGTSTWSFKGTRFSQLGSGSPTGTALDINGSGSGCFDCDVEGWYNGIAIGPDGTDTSDGFVVSGGYFENNVRAHILVGYSAGGVARGISIRGAYLHGNGITDRCVELDYANGFDITGNEFLNCKTYNVLAVADGTSPPQGADNGLVANNSTEGSGVYALYGSNITSISNGQITQFNSTSNCSSSANPAVCASDANGSVVIAAGSTSVTVDTTAVTAKSQIVVTFDSSLGSKLGVTCNTQFGAPYVSARTAGTSFTLSVSSEPATNPACFSYTIIN